MKNFKTLFTLLVISTVSSLAQRYSGTVMVNQPMYPIEPLMDSIPFRYENCPLNSNGDKLVMLPHPRDPNRYFVCQNGNAYPFSCGTGLYWHPIAQRCDFQRIATTQSAARPQMEVFFEYQRHPDDCSKYYRRQLLQCPPGTLWSSRAQQCELPYLSDCNYGVPSSNIPYSNQPVSNTPSMPFPQWNPNFNYTTTIQDLSSIQLNELCTKVASAYVHYPGDCHRFIQCNGIAFVHTCPSNLFWNSDLSVCDRYCK